METRKFGRTGMTVSLLGLGAAEIGLQDVDQGVADHLLGAGLDAGINVIDTAECYKNSEELIGRAVGHRRDDYYLFTKCGHAVDEGDVAWEPGTIARGLERSLKRLRCDHVDLLQLHSCPLDLLQRGDVLDALERLKSAGKTRFIGCSADGRAATYAIETGRLDALQTSFSIADQDALTVNIPLVRQYELGLIIKRPIANAVWRHAERPADPWLHAYWDRIQALDYAFLKQGSEDAISAALRFAATPEEVGTVIVGTTSRGHLLSNAGAISRGSLDPEVFASIRSRWAACGGEAWPAKG